MKPAITLALVPLLLGVIGAPLAQVPSSDPHHSSAPARTLVQPAERWRTDAALRTGMADIRTTVDALQHADHDHLDRGQVVTLATRIQQQVAYVVANCKLEPQADAALHAIIAGLGAGAQALMNDPGDHGAIASMRQALAYYPRQFDDPGWAQVDEPEKAR